MNEIEPWLDRAIARSWILQILNTIYGTHIVAYLIDPLLGFAQFERYEKPLRLSSYK